MLRTAFRFPLLSRSRPAAVRSRRRAARAAVLAGAAAFLVLNFGLGLGGELYTRGRDPVYGDRAAKLRPVLATRPSVVMLGTSRTGFGFHAFHVERRLAERGKPAAAFNFGVPASGPVTHLVYLNRLLDSGLAPDRLLLEVLPSMLGDDPRGPVEANWVFGDRLTHSEAELAVRFGFPAAKVRGEWRAAAFNPWHRTRFQMLGRVAPSWLPWHLRYDWSRGTDGRGWGTPLKDTVTDEERAAGNLRAAGEYGPTLADLHPGGPAAAAFRETLEVCRRRGVPVKLVRMPEGASFRALYPPPVAERIDAFLAEISREFPVEIIDARTWAPDDAFTDGHHLLRPGAEAFSDKLTDEVLLPWLP